MSFLMVQHIDYTYPDGGIHAVNDVSFSLEKGESLAVLGANGSGKSTLARLLTGFLEPDNGTVTLCADEKAVRLAGCVPSGMVFQSPKTQIISGVVGSDAALGPRNIGLNGEETDGRVNRLLELVELLAKKREPSASLSLGQTQKLALAGILALTPELLVLDEAVSMIDPACRKEILDFIDVYRKNGNSVISVTHDVDEALRYDRILAMDGGSAVFYGSRAEFEARPVLVNGIFGYQMPAPSAETGSDRTLIRNTVSSGLSKGAVAQAGAALAGGKQAAAPALVFDHVTFSYTGNPADAVLKDVDIAIPRGALVALMGPSGTGKSTLFELAAGLLTPTSGTVSAQGRPALALQDSESSLFEVFAADDVAYGPRNLGMSGKPLVQRVKDAMEMVGLPYAEFRDRPCRALSGGQKRKLSLAGIIALGSDVFLFDEPGAGLDPKGRVQVMETLQKLCAQGHTVVYSTHRYEEAACAGLMLEVRDGTVQWTETPASSDRSLIRNIVSSGLSKGAVSADTALVGGDSTANSSSAFAAPAEQSAPTEKAALFPVTKLDVTGLLEGLRVKTVGSGGAKPAPLAALHPLAKFLLFALVFIPSIAIKNFAALGVCIALSFAYSLAARVPVRRTVGVLAKLFPWLVFFTLLQFVVFPVQDGTQVLFQWHFVLVTAGKVRLAVRSLMRLSTAIFSMYGFLSTITDEEVIAALRLFCPKTVTLMVTVLFRFLPLLADEARLIIKVQLVRGGLGKKKGFFKMLAALLPLFVPLIGRTLDRAEQMGEALTARYF